MGKCRSGVTVGEAMPIAHTEVTGIHPLTDHTRLPCLHCSAHNMVCPLIRRNRGDRDAEAEKMHVK